LRRFAHERILSNGCGQCLHAEKEPHSECIVLLLEALAGLAELFRERRHRALDGDELFFERALLVLQVQNLVLETLRVEGQKSMAGGMSGEWT
jgi:hypothetical protein